MYSRKVSFITYYYVRHHHARKSLSSFDMQSSTKLLLIGRDTETNSVTQSQLRELLYEICTLGCFLADIRADWIRQRKLQ